MNYNFNMNTFTYMFPGIFFFESKSKLENTRSVIVTLYVTWVWAENNASPSGWENELINISFPMLPWAALRYT